ncbi:MAG TPA: glycosyltransferase family 39 protein [Gemmatimonadaceae bacterium]|nr:glycosyltransferase family 39 protein [Gemmatimonadaceae bacterium]
MTTVFGSLHPIAGVHDEAAYLLQARIFATFHWYAPARPLPRFFEQFHVFVTPVLAAKYPPGQSLLMVPGVWLAMPALVPIILAGVTGIFVYLLALRLSNEWVALLTWILWTTSRGVLRFLPTYLSQTTTSALWVAGWWALLRWRETAERRWLIVLAMCIGWGTITHPYSWVLFAIPTGVVVTVITARRRLWGDLKPGIVIGVACLAILGVQAQGITGSAFRSPWTVYAETYFPMDGFGLRTSRAQPLRELPPDMKEWGDHLRSLHEEYTLRNLPYQLVRRLVIIAGDAWGLGRWPLALFALVGVLSASTEVLFALASCAIVIGGFLFFVFYPGWSAYYVELLPVFAYITALGIWRTFAFVRSHRLRAGQFSPAASSPGAAVAVLLFIMLTIPRLVESVSWGREFQLDRRREQVSFRLGASKLPGKQIVVFVRYGPTHNVDRSLVINAPDLNAMRVWAVHDRGLDDLHLIRLAPDRVPYLFDGARNSFTQIDTAELAAEAKSRLSSGS